jgi:hypothetical protein
MGECFRISLLNAGVLGQFGKEELQRKGRVSECAVILKESASLPGARVQHLTGAWSSNQFPLLGPTCNHCLFKFLRPRCVNERNKRLDTG